MALFYPFSGIRYVSSQIISRAWCRFVLFICAIKIEISGLENIPKNTAIILASNHQGIMDIPILIGHIPLNFNFLTKKELFKIPFFGLDLVIRGDIAIDRGVRENAEKSLDKAGRHILKNKNIHIFPEGTRSRDGNLGSFKSGVIRLAAMTKAPILPIAISGSYNIIPKGKLSVTPSKVNLVIGKPLYLHVHDENDFAEVRKNCERLREAISEMIFTTPQTK